MKIALYAPVLIGSPTLFIKHPLSCIIPHYICPHAWWWAH